MLDVSAENIERAANAHTVGCIYTLVVLIYPFFLPRAAQPDKKHICIAGVDFIHHVIIVFKIAVLTAGYLQIGMLFFQFLTCSLIDLGSGTEQKKLKVFFFRTSHQVNTEGHAGNAGNFSSMKNFCSNLHPDSVTDIYLHRLWRKGVNNRRETARYLSSDIRAMP